ncbi:VanZ family protein [Leucobacter sp. USHLN153]|uniref:VanZ family protein n=1 Tax=Leucobacter sp. USHLN153 TaxID=3081268 RepID=UPI00301B1EE0
MPLRARVALWGLGLCGAATLIITMWPTPVDRNVRDALHAAFDDLHERGIATWFGYHELESLANVVMFMPLGFCVALLLSRRWRPLTLLLMPLASLLIEGAQLMLLPGRFATFDDVVANSIGGWIGAALAVVALRVARARGAAPRMVTGAPR